LPDSASATATAEALHAVVELDLDVPTDIEPPCGFGRDYAKRSGNFQSHFLGNIDICRLNCVMVVLPGIILAASRCAMTTTDESNREDVTDPDHDRVGTAVRGPGGGIAAGTMAAVASAVLV
jgi:hypothetical protein